MNVHEDVHHQVSLRSMAVLLSRAQERRSREIRARSARERAEKLLPPQSLRGFSTLARLYYLARPTKTAMLRRLPSSWTQIVYALDTKLVMPGHYKKTANQSVLLQPYR